MEKQVIEILKQWPTVLVLLYVGKRVYDVQAEQIKLQADQIKVMFKKYDETSLESIKAINRNTEAFGKFSEIVRNCTVKPRFENLQDRRQQ